MFLPGLPRKARGPPLLAWMLLTTRGKKYKPFKPEKTAEQKAEMRRATRNRRRETSRWLNSFVGGDPDVFVAAAADKKESRSARRRRKQGAAADAGVEHIEVDRELWEFLFRHQRSPRSSRKSERAWRRFEEFKGQAAADSGGGATWSAREPHSSAQEPPGGERGARQRRAGGGAARRAGGFAGGAFGGFGFASFADVGFGPGADSWGFDPDSGSFWFYEEARPRRSAAGWAWTEFDAGDGGGRRAHAEYNGGGRSGQGRARRGERGCGDSGAAAGGGAPEPCPVASSMRVLGLAAGGPLTGDLLRAAWRTKALESHPDRHPDPVKPAAEARFRAAHEAYVLLQQRLAL